MSGGPPLDYDEIGVLGRGVYGKAVLVQRKGSSEKLVVKHIPFEGLDATQISNAIHEVKALQMLLHPNIVRYRGSWVSSGGRAIHQDPVSYWSARGSTDTTDINTAASLPDALNIVTEYADGGSLDGLLKRNQGQLEEFLIALWLAQLILAIDHMHDCGVLHRDLKPANIFITKSGIVKVGDLGGCIMVEKPDDVCESEYGSPIYICPEVWHSGVCSHKSDVWSLGCVAYVLIALRPPFEPGPALVQQVLRQQPAQLPQNYSPGLRTVVGKMLSKEPSTRPSCRELRKDEYISKCIRLWIRVSCGGVLVPTEMDDVADVCTTVRHPKRDDVRDPCNFLLRRAAEMHKA